MRLENGSFRKLRRSFNDIGHAHELTFSCYRGMKLLEKDRSRSWFIDSLAKARKKHHLELWAYVIMPEHVHLLLLPTQESYSMAVILQAIKQSVSRRAIRYLRDNHPTWLQNLATRSPGIYHFWQPGGGYDRNITTASTAWKSVEYIHQNPMKRGLVESPIDWHWSSARWYAGVEDVVLPMDEAPPDP